LVGSQAAVGGRVLARLPDDLVQSYAEGRHVVPETRATSQHLISEKETLAQPLLKIAAMLSNDIRLLTVDEIAGFQYSHKLYRNNLTHCQSNRHNSDRNEQKHQTSSSASGK
jgi:hypothetical protein